MSKKKKTSRNEEEVLVPQELIQHIQSLLPVKEATRTCILSKWWLRAWSTIPTVRLSSPEPDNKYLTDEQETNYKNLIHRTLQRYDQNNIAIESLHLELHINNQHQLTSLPKTWIQPVVSKTCLKHLSLDISVFPHHDDDDDSSLLFTLPYELFFSQNLDTISVTAGTNDLVYPLRLAISSSTHIIRCVSLRVLDLQCVVISEDVFNNLLSTCTLLEKIKLWCCEGLKKNVKLTNLVRLCDLEISSLEEDDLWDITNVPTLASFYYRSLFGSWTKPIPFQMGSLASVTQLRLDGLALDNSFFDIVNAKFPLLQSLTLGIGHWGLPQLVITSHSLKWLTLDVHEPGPLDVQVHAPALLSFTFTGLHMIPGLSFSSIAPEHINLTFTRREPMDHSFFLKMREALNLSSKFDINIIHYNDNEHQQQEDSLVPSNIDVDDLKTRFSSHVTNLQLSLAASSDARLWEHSRFFDACFSICRPSYIKSPKPAVRKMIEGKTVDLKDVQLKNPLNGNWEALSCSWKSLLDTLDDHFHLECKLNWLSQ